MRSTLTDLASSKTFLTASESGASLVTISICACASTVGTGSASGSGACSRSISRLWRSAIENYSLTSNRGKRTGVFVTVAPGGSCPHVATPLIGWAPISPSAAFAPSDSHKISVVAGITG